jgi:hypothetical protein
MTALLYGRFVLLALLGALAAALMWVQCRDGEPSR